MPHTNYQLSGEEMERFRRQGYLGPYALCSPDEMRGMQPAIERVLETDAPDHGVREHNRHLDCLLIHELATHPAVVKRMAALYGPDLFCPGAKRTDKPVDTTSILCVTRYRRCRYLLF